MFIFCPLLSANLMRVGQLVENNYNMSFSSSGYVVQDQMSNKEIVRGPKCRRLFLVCLSAPIRKTL